MSYFGAVTMVGMKIAILGYADNGQSAYEYWNRDGNQLTILDQDKSKQLPAGAKSVLGPDYLKDLDKYDLIVRTSGLPPQLIIDANGPEIAKKVTSVTNEFLRVCPTKNVIGVTGTKGKGTTSTLIAKILESAGHRVHLAGNIGIPALELLKKNIDPDDWVVLELSSFQLIDHQYSPHIGVCLMVEPEHLNWHADMHEYITAKQQLFKWQKPTDMAIFYADNINSRNVASISPGHKIPYMQAPGALVLRGNIVIDEQIACHTDELKLLGKHNWQNVCAAVTAVWQVTQDLPAIQSVLTTFTGLEHRLELVRELGGVKYYDDSFGTTPETAIVALQAFTQPKIVILGGSDKGVNFDSLAEAVIANNVRAAICIGQMGPVIAKALKKAGFDKVIEGGKTMPEIVKVAQRKAKTGNVVLLSTGCASFGMFKDYKDRGEQFKKAVLALA